MGLGDHITVSCRGDPRHGIDVGGGLVVTINDEGVVLQTLHMFRSAANGVLRTVVYKEGVEFCKEQIVLRAMSRLGEGGYNVATWNSEHFCVWCCTGKRVSTKVQEAAGAALTFGLVAFFTPLAAASLPLLGAGGLLSLAAGGIQQPIRGTKPYRP